GPLRLARRAPKETAPFVPGRPVCLQPEVLPGPCFWARDRTAPGEPWTNLLQISGLVRLLEGGILRLCDRCPQASTARVAAALTQAGGPGSPIQILAACCEYGTADDRTGRPK